MPHGVGKRLSPNERAEVLQRYGAGESCPTLARAFGVSGTAIQKTILRAGGTIRHARDSHRVYPIDGSAFDVDTPAAAYWTGWMMSDGYVSDDGRFEITLQASDRDALDKFRTFLRAGNPVAVRSGPEGEPRYVRFGVRHPGISAALALRGVTPRKSLTACVLGPCAASRDFWRGVVDGDGSVTNYNNCPQVSLVGSEALTDQFVVFCAPLLRGYPVKRAAFAHSKGAWYARVHGDAAMVVMRALYVGAPPELALDRKRAIVERLLVEHEGRSFRILKSVTGDPTVPSSSFVPPRVAGRVHIAVPEWRSIIANHNVDAVAPAVAVGLTTSRPPYPVVTRERVLADFSALGAMDAAALIDDRPWQPRVALASPLVQLGSIASSGFGLRAADAFQYAERWRARHPYCPSPLARWHDEHNATLMVRGLWKSAAHGVTDDILRGKLLVHGYTPSQFRPTVMKALMQWAGARTVLDPCAGWGDRLVGFLACDRAKTYIGVDPSPGVHFGYRQAHRLLAPSKEARFIQGRIQDANIPAEDGSIDLIITSPPYFNLEQYPGVEKRWENADDWLCEFIEPMLKRCWPKLRRGGTMAVNVANVRIRRNTYDLVGGFMKSAAGLPGCSLLGAFGMFLAPRPVKTTHEIPAEPILIWRKQ